MSTILYACLHVDALLIGFHEPLCVYMCIYYSHPICTDIYFMCAYIYTYIYTYIFTYTHCGVSSVSVHTPYTHLYSNLIHLDVCLHFTCITNRLYFSRMHMACLPSFSLSRSVTPPLALPSFCLSLSSVR